MKNFVLFFLVTILAYQAQAQTQDAPWGLGVYPSAMSFDALSEDALFDAERYEPGVKFLLGRYLNRSFDMGLEGTLAVLRHPASVNNNEEGELERDNFYDGNFFLRYKLYNGYLFGQNSFISPYLKAGIGPNKSVSTEDIGIHAPLGVGLNIRLGKSAYLTAESNYKYGITNSEDYLHHAVGITINLGKPAQKLNLRDTPPDMDNDGVPDFADKCPDIKGAVLASGCPDADDDGVLDNADKCPNTPGYANLSGCLDKDSDGISDIEDKCPNLYGVADFDGCPNRKGRDVSLDTDGDKIPDELDGCPNEKGSFTAGGCPDTDGDGMIDKNDNCPDEYGKTEFAGCPYDAVGMERLAKGFDPTKAPTQKVVTKTVAPSTEPTSFSSLSVGSVARTEVVSTAFDYCAYFDEFRADFEQGILFNSGSVALKNTTKKTLNRLAKFAKKCGSRSIIIKAHTDNVGDEPYNIQLSERRAEAVKNYLVAKGVNPELLSTIGYGSMQPIAANDTPENRAKNRRVELEIR